MKVQTGPAVEAPGGGRVVAALAPGNRGCQGERGEGGRGPRASR
jgi:hypothetical protein